MRQLLLSPKRDEIVIASSNRLAGGIGRDFTLLKHNVQHQSLWERVYNSLLASNLQVATRGYTLTRQFLNRPVDRNDLHMLRRDIIAWSKFVIDEVKEYTLDELGIQAANKKNRLLGKNRNKVIVSNNVYTSFFKGARRGWMSDLLSAEKEWLISGRHDQEDICDENSDAGGIGLEEAFPSGDLAPPAHISCECDLWVRMVR